MNDSAGWDEKGAAALWGAEPEVPGAPEDLAQPSRTCPGHSCSLTSLCCLELPPSSPDPLKPQGGRNQF